MAADTEQYSPYSPPVSEHVVDKETSEPTSSVASMTSIAFTVMSGIAAVVYDGELRPDLPLNFNAHKVLWIYASALLMTVSVCSMIVACARREKHVGIVAKAAVVASAVIALICGRSSVCRI